MPLYEYQCDDCERRFEVIQKYSDPWVEGCPTCHGPVTRLISAPAIQFKGSGFYLTDYGRSGQGKGDGDGATSGKTDNGGGDAGKSESTKGEGASDNKSPDRKTTESQTADSKASESKASESKTTETRSSTPDSSTSSTKAP